MDTTPTNFSNNFDKDDETMDFEEGKKTKKRDSSDSGEESSTNNREDEASANK